MGRAQRSVAALVGREGWTIVQRCDPAMDLHLTLMVQAADEALRSLRAADEHAGRRQGGLAVSAIKVNRLYPS